MIEIVTQKDLAALKSMEFCYLCGKVLTSSDSITRDHVPPRTIFLADDRDSPLILPTHDGCNQGQSQYDEMVGQLISFLHGTPPRSDQLRLNIRGGRVTQDGSPITFTTNLDLREVVRRWIRGFHAALYREYLPEGPKFAIHVPFPHGTVNRENKVSWELLLSQVPVIVEEIKKNRMTRTLDKIECCNGKCIYECVWQRADDGRPFCMFALKLYEWQRLADPRFPASRGCVGAYEPPNGIPKGGRVSTDLVFPFLNGDPLDPYQ